MGKCDCPAPSALATIPSSDCSFNLKEIQKIVLGKSGKVIWDSAIGGGTGLLGVPQVDSQLNLKADWQSALALTDEYKLIITPFIGREPKIEAGDNVTEVGLNGVEEINEVNPSTLTAMFTGLTPEQEKAIKLATCNPLEIYLINQDNKIFCVKKEGATTEHTGIRTQTVSLSDRNVGGYGMKDTHTLTIVLRAGWSENLVSVTPSDFNALYDLVNP